MSLIYLIIFLLISDSIERNLSTNKSGEKIINVVSTTKRVINKANSLLNKFVKEDYKLLSTNETNCVCVPYHLCPQVNFGEGVIDVKYQENPCSTSGEVCCLSKHYRPASTRDVSKCGFPSDFEFTSANAFLDNSTDDTVSAFGEYPWTALVFANSQYICTGSLIHPKVVLTSALCVRSKVQQYTVRLGEWNRNSIKEPLGYENQKVIYTLKHPKFEISNLFYNAALLVVDYPFVLQPNVKTICLADDLELHVLSFYKNCVASGWGKDTPIGRFRNKMKKIKFSLVKHKLCESQLQNSALGTSYVLHKTFMCGINHQNYDICDGDNGGPFVCPVSKHPLRFKQYGITAWSVDCFGNFPTVFTRVSYVTDWIDGEFDNLGFDKRYYKL